MGLKSLGMGKACPRWEWNKHFVTSRDITYFLSELEQRQKIAHAPCLCQLLACLSDPACVGLVTISWLQNEIKYGGTNKPLISGT